MNERDEDRKKIKADYDKAWVTLQGVQSGKIDAANADSVATQAREILRCTNTQLQIFRQAKRNVSVDVINFAEQA